MRYWSGTSTASAGTNRAAKVATSSSRLQTTRGSACTSAAAPVTRNSPTPTTIHTRSASSPWTSSARATAAATAATRAVTPTIVGSRSGSGAQTTANAAAPANAGAATIRCALSRPSGSTPRNAEKASSATVSCPWSVSRPPTREPTQPASTATPTATVNQVTENAPGGVVPGSSGTWSPACRRTAPPAASTSPLRTPSSASEDWAGSTFPSRLCSVGANWRPALTAYSRATSSTDASGGTTRSSAPAEPCTVSATVLCASRRPPSVPATAITAFTVPSRLARASGRLVPPMWGTPIIERIRLGQ